MLFDCNIVQPLLSRIRFRERKGCVSASARVSLSEYSFVRRLLINSRHSFEDPLQTVGDVKSADLFCTASDTSWIVHINASLDVLLSNTTQAFLWSA